MKILVSSKTFSKVFKRFEDQQVRTVVIKNNEFTAHTIDDSIMMCVETKDNNLEVEQFTARGDWLLKDLGRIGERLIVLEFTHNTAKFTLEY